MNSPTKLRDRRHVQLTSTVLAAGLAAIGTLANAQDRDRVVLGVGASFGPAYRGSDDDRIRPLPLIDVKKGRFYANLRNGLGVNLVENGTLTVGGGVTYVQGYRSSDVPEGVDRPKAGAGARAYATLRSGGFVATLGGTKGLGDGNKGFIADVGVSYPILISPKFTLAPSIAAAWTDGRYNDDFYGVSGGESLASGLPAYRAKSGVRDVTAALSAVYRLTDRMTLTATGGVTTLVGDVKDSPLVLEKTQPIGLVAIGYRF